ncbi:DUF3159 domain-containing protein [Actinokineospora globicatena]|uniref:Intracellular septation protein A n=1 Tax=Actinokineospora globicatena TaxID=103729 RepID=A0A9W6QMC5_9PSEU|nr:DUF3159 domain-containing protein [Actinokineospora globicatena]GLW93053.1 hypothetical protein Aglo03_38690 [Actinokineospora globicatena]
MSDSLSDLLGGRRGAIDATAPPVAFAAAWLVTGSIGLASAAALLVAVVVGALRLSRGEKVTAVLGGMLAVAVGALVVLYTGRAEDFFLIQLLTNIASALAWAVSIIIRRPLLGVVVGLLLGQRLRWRQDPDLLRAYSRASWVWVLLQYTLRTAVFGLLWWLGNVAALAIARVALSWPLVALVIAVSATVLRKSLPADHPGLRHPRLPAPAEPPVQQSGPPS